MTRTVFRIIGTSFGIFFVLAAGARPVTASHIEQVRQGFTTAQACEVEIDDDLTSYGECIGHAVDRLNGQRLTLLGLHFQAWLIADLAARQGSTRSQLLRQRYQQALSRGLRANRWNIGQLCEAKKMRCDSVKQRLQQKI